MARTTVDEYLRELDQELRDLPASKRNDLLQEIREHIDSALEGAPNGDGAEVRNVLDRLGDPPRSRPRPGSASASAGRGPGSGRRWR